MSSSVHSVNSTITFPESHAMNVLVYISPTVCLQKTTRNRLDDVLMPIYMTEDETKALTKVHDNNTNNEVIIPVFDIHS